MDVSALQSLISTVATGTVKKTDVQSGADTTSAQTNATKDVFNSKLAEIASRYDVKNISSRQTVEMGRSCTAADLFRNYSMRY